MPTESCRVSGVIAATPEQIYAAWLDSKKHGAMTGGAADITAAVGSRFTAWDGYIEGTTLHLEPGRRIVQAWRTSEFPVGSPDSRLEVLFAPADGGTEVTIIHSDIPEGQGHQYEEGWQDNYLIPMKAYFARPAPAKKKAARKASKSKKKVARTPRRAAKRKKAGRKARR